MTKGVAISAGGGRLFRDRAQVVTDKDPMNNFQANICLFTVTICWSCEVVILSVIPEGVSPLATTCVTSLIGALLLGGCFFRRIIPAVRRHKGVLLRRVALLSMLNVTYNVLIEYGLDYLDVSTGAFTLSMTAVVLPVMLLVARRGTNLRTWISALFVLAGIAVALVPIVDMPKLPGFAVMFSSCLIRAIFIIKLNDYAKEFEPVSLAAGITIMNTFFAFVLWLFVQPTTFLALPWTPQLIALFVVYGYLIVAFATVLNVFAQRNASATHATIIYSTEILFSLFWAACLPSTLLEPITITGPLVFGCLLVVLGNIIKITPIGPDSESEDDGPEEIEEAEEETEPPVPKSEPVRMSDLVTSLLGRLPNKLLRCAALFIMLLVVYLIIALPFRTLTIIPGFTDFRPVCMLQPVYGIFFGLPGCLAFATGNLIGDIVSDSLRWSSIAGFVGNFLCPFLLYLFWTQIRKKPFNLRTRHRVAMFTASIVACACVQSLVITPVVAYFYPDVDAVLFAASVIGNGAIFPIAFATPFIVLIQEELAFVPVERKRLLPGLVLGTKR